MKARTLAFGMLFGCAVPAAAAQDWTPHAAAALLDATFPTAQTCQRALDDARRRESRAAPVNGLSYTHLFEQGRCQSSAHKGEIAWRIHMHWAPRASGQRRAQTH